ncbi:5-formyltetrahydrofolate cyclo-ligase [Mycobacterium xenopi]|uniref:5-formyltetrahydrofolate cyclo-ligase n=1 Tax=Mycobacterium xenopi TaxID=1789 RepID=A0AAD1GZ35_MYCXE|nr:5-formyltetrahydrofolate cyclo-ligase [Mycobacterium xenopi]MDA3640647.1 5-formyltetrahydrofolate cyclo-ligase [Mycobacterium xenopi]MDA3657278.1 5-formyltetrahydrofolate cyclo-ligase [Mycobacterium xenopi]ORX21553.1 5-formyltetrahydrofolate cyclo-ligase [Mycobacterium xenopi]SPX78622.1 5-formyltetrahydrofolate cyclo-ligase [Mycobacterium xenopi]BBU21491.1 5-formyltetrahydrofolate cyclo-ligase [Mycobacterium xenopi]
MGTAGKATLRQRLLAARRSVADEVRAAEAHSLAEQLTRLATNGDTVCAYVPVGAEPGSLEMLDVLRRRVRRVLLPVARTRADDTPLPLRWGEYRPGGLVAGRFGLLEPAEPWLPASALTEAGLVLVPALAVDRRGMRLGRGLGFYDRSLVCCDPRAQLVAVVRDAELVDELPSEAHDVPMTHALTPGRGMVALHTAGMRRPM